MLELSAADIEAGRLIYQDDLAKLDRENLKTID
jgi:hypothetical protein